MILTGKEAIDYALDNGLSTLNKYADPIEDATEVDIDEALEIAREDAGLIWIEED